LTVFQAPFFAFRTLQSAKSRLVFWIPQRADLKNKTCFLDFAACRVQKQSFFFEVCTLRNAKTELVFGVCTLHGAKTKSVFRLCTLRSGHSKLVFYTLHTAECKISICFCILQRNES